ncbi:hypothetical protein LDENG_00195270 [Lucifuga dentata]|nr:hypothetical protein LDENG_00195270 [Lucifuga dentata]
MMSSFETVQCVVLVVSLLVCALLILQQLSDTINADWSIPLPELSVLSSQRLKSPAVKSDECGAHKDCPKDQFSFFIQSGAANVVAPKICLQNNLVLGDAKDNADFGINIVVINGKTGEIIMTSHFNMWDGDVKTLIEFLKSIKDGSAVLMTTFDDPATKLNEEARKLIADMGSSAIRSLGVRDNWIFVGGKGAMFQSHYEMLCSISPSILLLGDFNIHIDSTDCKIATEYLDILNCFSLTQHINFPTHNRGHIPDLVCSTGITINHLSSSHLTISPTTLLSSWTLTSAS